MRAGLPSAIGAKLTNPEIKVAAIYGDGGVMYRKIRKKHFMNRHSCKYSI